MRTAGGSPPHELVNQAQAALASRDTARIYLLGRYLGQRIEAERGRGNGRADPDLLAVVRDLAATFDGQGLAERRRDLETKIRRAKALPIAVSTDRRQIDGSDERMRVEMRQQLTSLV